MAAGGGAGEAEILKRLDHQCIPELYDIFEDEDYLYLVEEYFKGESLTELCKSRLLSFKEVLNHITEICSVIQYLHTLPEAVLHLDVKPDNIVISGDKACLIDFGSAITMDNNTHGRTMSRGFAAPEQEARLKVDRGTDVYALGKVLEFMVAHSKMGDDAARRFGKIIDCCCTDKPWKRVSSAGTMLKMLNRIRKSETDKAHAEQSTADKTNCSCRSVGVVGLGPRNGTTHIAIAMANFLADVKGFKVCLAENSDHNDVSLLPEIMERSRNAGGGPVKINGVTYLTSGFAYDGKLQKNGKFDYIVYDLGSDMRKAELTLMNCDTEIAVGCAAPWRSEEYLTFRRTYGQAGDERKRIILINPAEARSMRMIAAGDIGMLPFPYEPDPMHPGKDTVKILERAIR